MRGVIEDLKEDHTSNLEIRISSEQAAATAESLNTIEAKKEPFPKRKTII